MQQARIPVEARIRLDRVVLDVAELYVFDDDGQRGTAAGRRILHGEASVRSEELAESSDGPSCFDSKVWVEAIWELGTERQKMMDLAWGKGAHTWVVELRALKHGCVIDFEKTSRYEKRK